MSIIVLIFVFLIGISVGGYLQIKLTKRALKIEQERIAESKKSQFFELVSSLKNGRTQFKSRVNDTVYISTSLKDIGDVDLIYLMDKNDIAVFQNTRCIHTSDGVDKELVNEIISLIYRIHNTKINDVVEILGFVFYREEFEKSFNIKAEDLKKSNLFSNITMETSEIDKINSDNQNKYDIDELLDKISAHGINSLTFEERLFLDKYSNEKRD